MKAIKILDKYNLPDYKTHKSANTVAYNKQTQFSNSAPFVSLGSMKPSTENAIYKTNDAPKMDINNSRKPKTVTSIDEQQAVNERPDSSLNGLESRRQCNDASI